jgi:hypothetical protein
MLERRLQKGMAANWLPTAEAGVAGAGKEMSTGCIDVEGGIYLPFAANGINYTESQGKDVISYNFTGCIMATYTTRGGSRRVCHVSTGQGQDCLGEWATIKGSASQVLAFKPHLFADIAAIGQAQQAFHCYGLITATGECYSIAVGGQLGSQGTVAKMVIVISCERVTQFV